jgi:O-antigen/teichoic acid export membrane protein
MAEIQRPTFVPIALLGLGIGLLLSALSFPLARLLQLDSPLWIVWLALIWLISLPLPAAKGVLQGRQRFTRLAALNVLEPAIKLLAGIGFVSLGLGLWGAWGAWGMAALLAFFVAFMGLQSSGAGASASTSTSA